MRARRGQSGTIVRKGDQWHVRFYVDEEKGRKKKSVPVGLAVGKGRLTKAEAARKAYQEWLNADGSSGGGTGDGPEDVAPAA